MSGDKDDRDEREVVLDLADFVDDTYEAVVPTPLKNRHVSLKILLKKNFDPESAAVKATETPTNGRYQSGSTEDQSEVDPKKHAGYDVGDDDASIDASESNLSVGGEADHVESAETSHSETESDDNLHDVDQAYDDQLLFEDIDDVPDTIEILQDRPDAGATDLDVIFNNLLSQLRENPSIVSKRIRLQPGQSLVTAPHDIRRIVKYVRRLIDASLSFTAPTEDPASRLFSRLSSPHPDFRYARILPVIYDRKVVFDNEVTPEQLKNQNTVEYHNEADHLKVLIHLYPEKISDTRKIRHTIPSYSIQPYRTPPTSVSLGQKIVTPVTPTIEPIDTFFQTQHDLGCETNAFTEPIQLDSFSEAYRIESNTSIAQLSPNSSHQQPEESLPLTLINVRYRQKSLVPSPPNDDDTRLIVGWVRIRTPITARLDQIVYPAHLDTNIPPDNLEIVIAPDKVDATLSDWIGDPTELLRQNRPSIDFCLDYIQLAEVLDSIDMTLSDLTPSHVSFLRNVVTVNVLELIKRHEIDDKRSSKKSDTNSESRHVYEKNDHANAMMNVYDKYLVNIKQGLSYIHTEIGDGKSLAHEIDQIKAKIDSYESTPNLPSIVSLTMQDLLSLAKTIKSRKDKHEGLSPIADRLQDELYLSHLKQICAARRILTSSKRFLRLWITKIMHHANEAKLPGIQIGPSLLDLFRPESGLPHGMDRDDLDDVIDEIEFDFTIFTGGQVKSLDTDLSFRFKPPTHLQSETQSAIWNAFLIMMTSEKLNFSPDEATLTLMTEDCSRMFDTLENQTDYRRRYSIDDARERFNQDIGDPRNITTNYKISVILARLLIELETHRPVYPFKKAFPLSGFKTIGNNLDIKYVIFNQENKFRYLVDVAARSATLGRIGKLVQNSQENNLKIVEDLVLSFYDRFQLFPLIQSAYSAAELLDENRRLLMSDETKIKQEPFPLTGFETLMMGADTIRNPRTALLIKQYHQYNIDLKSINLSSTPIKKRYRQFSIDKKLLWKKSKYLAYKILETTQLDLEVTKDYLTYTSSNYDPNLYGEKHSQSAIRIVTILNTFTSGDNEKFRESSKKVEQFVRLNFSKKISLLVLPQKVRHPTYRPKHTHIDFPASLIEIARYVDPHFANKSEIRQSPTEFTVFSSVPFLRQHQFSREQEGEIFQITRMYPIKVEQFETRLSIDTPDIRRYIIERGLTYYKFNIAMLKNMYFMLKRHVTILTHGLLLKLNSYAVLSEYSSSPPATSEVNQQVSTAERESRPFSSRFLISRSNRQFRGSIKTRSIDDKVYTGSIDHITVDVGLTQQGFYKNTFMDISYLVKYGDLGKFLADFTFNFDRDYSTTPLQAHSSHSQFAEHLCNCLVQEFINLIRHTDGQKLSVVCSSWTL